MLNAFYLNKADLSMIRKDFFFVFKIISFFYYFPLNSIAYIIITTRPIIVITRISTMKSEKIYNLKRSAMLTDTNGIGPLVGIPYARKKY